MPRKHYKPEGIVQAIVNETTMVKGDDRRDAARMPLQSSAFHWTY